MNFAMTILPFCLLLMCFQPLSAQSKRRRLVDLPPFEWAVVCIKYFDEMHSKKIPHTLGMIINYCQANTSRQQCRNGRRTLSCVLTFGNALNTSKDMEKMPYYLPSYPTMLEWVAYWDTANIPRADCYER